MHTKNSARCHTIPMKLLWHLADMPTIFGKSWRSIVPLAFCTMRIFVIPRVRSVVCYQLRCTAIPCMCTGIASQFDFRPGHSTLDMLLLLSQQWMEVLNAGHEIRAISRDISRAFDMVCHPALLTKLSSYGIQGHLHSWLTDFLSCHSQRVALNGVLSSPLPVQARVPQGSVLGRVPFLVFINDLSDSLENPLYLFADDSTLCCTICHPSYR